jgi:hypothetical protein
MTVIAYRDGILACDSLWTCGILKILWHTKIIRLASGALFGDSGDADNRALLALVNDVDRPKDLPSAEDCAEFRSASVSLLIFPDKTGWFIATPGADKANGSCGVWPAWKGRNGFATVGCGEQLALGAMEHGASAVNAVKVACKRNVHCGLPVHTLEFKL